MDMASWVESHFHPGVMSIYIVGILTLFNHLDTDEPKVKQTKKVGCVLC